MIICKWIPLKRFKYTSFREPAVAENNKDVDTRHGTLSEIIFLLKTLTLETDCQYYFISNQWWATESKPVVQLQSTKKPRQDCSYVILPLSHLLTLPSTAGGCHPQSLCNSKTVISQRLALVFYPNTAQSPFHHHVNFIQRDRSQLHLN